ncbi:MAG: alternative ribosome rescue aminoacyl-tRNA hydrolase ArfB [Flavobacterium sp.]|nr:alternative ribosome rescue aminoacyl-tRNA hydrolase ArfB [Flavobacterium sp.]
MDWLQLQKELRYKAIRSAGPGGQHVNKVSSKIVLSFDVVNSQALTESEKQQLLQKWASRLSKEQQIQLSCDESRSQIQNKTRALRRFLSLLEAALVIKKTRKETKVPKSAIRKRLQDKQSWSSIKKLRRKPDL